jgi:lysozyme
VSFWAWLRAKPAPKPALPHVVIPVPEPAPVAANAPMQWPDTRGGPVPEAAVALIAEFEGFGDAAAVRRGRVKSTGHPYICPAGKPTIGYGATFYPDTGKAVTMDDPPITEAQGRLMLRKHAAGFAADVDRLVKVPLSVGERGALISFAFNFGAGALAKSTLLKKLNAGDRAGAAAEFARWNKQGSSILEGLTRRRAAEAAMFRGV